jgi:hypothetical protein
VDCTLSASISREFRGSSANLSKLIPGSVPMTAKNADYLHVSDTLVVA